MGESEWIESLQDKIDEMNEEIEALNNQNGELRKMIANLHEFLMDQRRDALQCIRDNSP